MCWLVGKVEDMNICYRGNGSTWSRNRLRIGIYEVAGCKQPQWAVGITSGAHFSLFGARFVVTWGWPWDGDMVERRRCNGWSWPPSLLQLFCWAAIPVIAPSSAFLLIPVHILYAPLAVLVATFWIVLQIVVLTSIDPAVNNLRRDTAPAHFDASKHEHVIENQYCNICLINVLVALHIAYWKYGCGSSCPAVLPSREIDGCPHYRCYTTARVVCALEHLWSICEGFPLKYVRDCNSHKTRPDCVQPACFEGWQPQCAVISRTFNWNIHPKWHRVVGFDLVLLST